MGSLPPFEWSTGVDLPGNERLAKYGMATIRRLVHRLWDMDIEGFDHVPTRGPAIIAPTALERFTKNVSSASTIRSRLTVTVTCCDIAPPAPKFIGVVEIAT